MGTEHMPRRSGIEGPGLRDPPGIHLQRGGSRSVHARKGKSPPVVGDATWKDVQKLLDEAGMKSFVADETEPGIVRVRYIQYESSPWDKVREILTPHYDVVERYEHGQKYHDELREDCKDRDVWFQVTRKSWSLDEHIALDAETRKQRITRILESGGGHKGYGSSFYKPQKVGAAMVRAEVWEGMVALGGMDLGWGSPDTIDAFVEKTKIIAREGVKTLQSDGYCAHFFIENLFRDNGWFVETGYQGVAKLFLRYIEHLSKGTMPESQLEHIARGVGETVLVESYMRWMGAMWAPSSYMSEGLPVDLQVAYHKIVADALNGIVKKHAEYGNE